MDVGLTPQRWQLVAELLDAAHQPIEAAGQLTL
jgi:hypothetical protein